jgi:hypothetical protein
MGMLSEEWGKGPVDDRPAAGRDADDRLQPEGLQHVFMAIVAPQPLAGQVPWLISPSSGRVSFIVRSFFISDSYPADLLGGPARADADRKMSLKSPGVMSRPPSLAT